jgi:hypothetical protein
MKPENVRMGRLNAGAAARPFRDRAARRADRAGEVRWRDEILERRIWRIEASERGESFMPYRAAELRLRKAIVGVAAGDAAALVKRVFDGG